QALLKTGDTGVDIPLIVVGILFLGTGICLLTLKRRHVKQILLVLVVFGGSSLLVGSFAQAAETSSLKPEETILVTKGTKETKKPEAITGYTYVGYLYTTKNDTPPAPPLPVEKGTVTVHYQDEQGNVLAPEETEEGTVGSPYTTVKKTIEGYDYQTVQGNPTGNFTKDTQVVTYIYTPTPVVAGNVTVQYVDQDGKEVHASQTINGYVGDSYDASSDTYKLKIEGYTLDETKLPTNANGFMQEQAQQVTYVYTKEAQDVTITIKFVDSKGKPFMMPNLTTYNGGSFVPNYPNLAQYQMKLDYNQQVYSQEEPIPDIVIPSKEGESYSLPSKMTFNIVNDKGMVVSYVSDIYGGGIIDWENFVAPTNREGTLSSDNVVVTYVIAPYKMQSPP
ncbi:MucBP domain-containing protein, partial [Listeria monocytogenes]|nr:MucBP domain-containing protein [Listeria monocytogenes]